jgi:hypothetical protein
MKNQTLDKLIWILLYGGLLTVGVSLAVPAGSPTVAGVLTAGGAGAAVLGVVLLVLRSRRKP